MSQYVFIALAKQAAALSGRDQLAGWFYTTIRNAASQLVRAEARRRVHEAELQSQAAALALKVDAARKAAEIARAKAQSAKNAALARTEMGKADARDFFSQYSEGKAALLQFFKTEAAAGDALFYRKAGLTPAQTQALVNQVANHWLDSTVLLPESAYFTGPELPDDQLQGILGDQAFQAYKDNENSRPALGWVGVVARSAAEGGVPLSLDQDELLSAAVTSNSPDYTKGAAVNPANVSTPSRRRKTCP